MATLRLRARMPASSFLFAAEEGRSVQSAIATLAILHPLRLASITGSQQGFPVKIAPVPASTRLRPFGSPEIAEVPVFAALTCAENAGICTQ